MKVYAIQNSVSEIRRYSSAGGVFSILAENVINQGGVVYGVGFDNEWNVCHKRVTSLEGIVELRGSKYVFSNIGASMKQVVKDLHDGLPVMFSGTPCQAAAIRKLAADNRNLLIVEVVCHGAPRPDYWSRYLDEICHNTKHTRQDIENISFRDKKTGWKTYSFTIKFKDGHIFTQRGSDNLYMRAFLRDYTLREPCFRCKFKQPNGCNADITLGDFWGIEHIAPYLDNNWGTTVAITSTGKGEKALEGIAKLCSLDYEKVIKYNPAICNAARMPEKYRSFGQATSSSKYLIPILNRFVGVTYKERLKKILKNIIQR